MILAFAFATLLVGVFGGCPEGFIRWDEGKTCYHISDITATRHDAQMYCEVFDANLVSVESELENYFLKFAIKNKLVKAPGDYHMKKLKFLKGLGSYWTSGIHKEGTNQWTWQADERELAETMDYTYWGAYQPNATITYTYDQLGKMIMHKWKQAMHGGKTTKHSTGMRRMRRYHGGMGGMNSRRGHQKWQKKDDDDSDEKKGHYVKRNQRTQGSNHGNAGMNNGYQQQPMQHAGYKMRQATGNRRWKRSLFPENWLPDETKHYEEDEEQEESSSTEEEQQQPRHSTTWQIDIPDLRGDNCTVIRKCMKDHNITWYSVPCVEHDVQRFFICEKPCSMAAQADMDDDEVDNIPYSEGEGHAEGEAEGEAAAYSEPESPYQG